MLNHKKKTMLQYLSGVNDNQNANVNGFFEDVVNNVKSSFQNVVKNVQNFTSNLPRITLPNLNMPAFSQKLKRISVAPARGAFLLLVSKNFTKMADRLADAYRLQPAKVRDMWVKGYGGDWNKLKTAINQGTRSAKINGVVVTAGAVMGTIAAALPILAGTIALVKSIRGNRDAADSMADQQLLNDMAGRINEADISTINNDAPADSAFNIQSLLIPGLGIVAVLLLIRKNN